jgi:hypothetical protein
MSCATCVTDPRAKLTHDHSELGEHHEDVTESAPAIYVWGMDFNVDGVVVVARSSR